MAIISMCGHYNKSDEPACDAVLEIDHQTRLVGGLYDPIAYLQSDYPPRRIAAMMDSACYPRLLVSMNCQRLVLAPA